MHQESKCALQPHRQIRRDNIDSIIICNQLQNQALKKLLKFLASLLQRAKVEAHLEKFFSRILMH